VLGTWALAYLAVWVLATVVVLVMGNRLSDRRSPAAHPLALSIVAGAVWPMLIVGAVEFAAVALCAKARDARAAADMPEFRLSPMAAGGSVIPLR
jgi:hypothetical protein